MIWNWLLKRFNKKGKITSGKITIDVEISELKKRKLRLLKNARDYGEYSLYLLNELDNYELANEFQDYATQELNKYYKLNK